MFEKLRYFLRYAINKSKKQECPSYVTLINNLPEGTMKYINGSISLCQCKGNDCIVAVIYFKGYYKSHRRLFSKYNYWSDDCIWVVYFQRL